MTGPFKTRQRIIQRHITHCLARRTNTVALQRPRSKDLPPGVTLLLTGRPSEVTRGGGAAPLISRMPEDTQSERGKDSHTLWWGSPRRGVYDYVRDFMCSVGVWQGLYIMNMKTFTHENPADLSCGLRKWILRTQSISEYGHWRGGGG